MHENPQVASVCRRWGLLALYVARDAAHRASQHLPIPGMARVAYLTPRGMTLAEHGRTRFAAELRDTLGAPQLELVDLAAVDHASTHRVLEDCTRVWCVDPVFCEELLAVTG